VTLNSGLRSKSKTKLTA